MSSRDQPETVERVLDDSASRSERTDAIEHLALSNDCDELAGLVRREELDRELRERALAELATPQCSESLDDVAADESLDDELREDAIERSREMDGGDGQPTSSI